MVLRTPRCKDRQWTIPMLLVLGLLLAACGGNQEATDSSPSAAVPEQPPITNDNTADVVKIATLEGHTDPVSDVVFSPDSSLLASASDDGTVKVWDIATGAETATLGNAEWVPEIAFHPDGELLASASRDERGQGIITLWDVAQGTRITTLDGRTQLSTVAFSPDGTLLASGWCVEESTAGSISFCTESKVYMWDVANIEEQRTLDGHEAVIFDVAFSPDSSMIASGSADDTVKLWNVATGEEMSTLDRHTASVSDLMFSPDSSLLASTARERTVILWDVAAGEATTTLEDASEVWSVAFNPEGSVLATASYNTVTLWNVATEEVLTRLDTQGGAIYDVEFSPDGGMVAAASEDGTLSLWGIETAQ